MVNILVLASGGDRHFSHMYYPKNMVEIKEKPMIQWVIENYDNVKDSNLLITLLSEECSKFHTNNTINTLTNKKAEVIILNNMTQGALCTALMSIDYIDNDDELLIVNADQFIDKDINSIIEDFRKEGADCGLLCCKSVHPRWSYVVSEGDEVIQIAEKKPVSMDAIAGFYYFRHGKDFITSAKRVIKKGGKVSGAYYISSSVNEMILQGKKVRKQRVTSEEYHTFYSPEKVEEYLKL